MTITRYLPAVVLAVAAVGPATAQTGLRPYTPPGRTSGLVPSVSPGGDEEVASLPGRPTIGENGLDRLTKPQAPPAAGNPVGTLTGQPLGGGPRELPPGSVASPWYTDGPGCCGPMGANGRIAYDPYLRLGVTTPFGSGVFTDRLHSGLQVGGGGRTLFFDQDHQAAWVIDLGLSYQHNRGKLAYPIDLFVKSFTVNQATNQVTINPDQFISVRIRGLHRTTFNFGVGRDWFVWGPGSPGAETGWNMRFGTDFSGRWGTAHIDLLREDSNDFYFRRQGITHGFTFGTHLGWEKPMGSWVLFGGLRAEYTYDWMNIAPPIKSDVQDVNLLLNMGIRF